MTFTRSALAALLLSAACLAAPLPFERKKVSRPQDPIEELLSRFAGGELTIPDLSARISAESVRDKTLFGVVIKAYDATGALAHTLRARKGDLRVGSGSKSITLRLRWGDSESADGSLALWDERTVEFRWPPAAK